MGITINAGIDKVAFDDTSISFSDALGTGTGGEVIQKVEWNYGDVDEYILIKYDASGVAESTDIQLGKHLYRTEGTYTATLRLTGSLGTIATDTLTVRIEQAVTFYTNIETIELATGIPVGEEATDDIPTAAAQLFLYDSKVWIDTVAAGDLVNLSADQLQLISSLLVAGSFFHYLRDLVLNDEQINYAIGGVSVNKEVRIKLLDDIGNQYMKRSRDALRMMLGSDLLYEKSGSVFNKPFSKFVEEQRLRRWSL